MDTQTIHSIIQLIDKQLSEVELNNNNQPIISSLVNLRNEIISTFKPDSSLDWRIKNKKMLKFFKLRVKWT